MRKALAIACLCGGVTYGFTATAAAESPLIQLCALAGNYTPVPQKAHSSGVRLAGSCSITCGNRSYSQTCPDGHNCNCNCNQGCYCG